MSRVFLFFSILIFIAVATAVDFNVYQPTDGEYKGSPEFWVYVQHEKPGDIWLELNGERFYSEESLGGHYAFLEGEVFNLSEGEYTYSVVLDTGSETIRSETRNFSVTEASPALDIGYDVESRELFYRIEWNSSGELRLLSDQQVLQTHDFSPPRSEYRFPVDGDQSSFRLEFEDGDQVYETGTLEVPEEEIGSRTGDVSDSERESANDTEASGQSFESRNILYALLVLALLFLVFYSMRNKESSEADEDSDRSKSGSISELKEKYR